MKSYQLLAISPSSVLKVFEQKFITMSTFVQDFVSFVKESFFITVENVVLLPKTQITFFTTSSIGGTLSNYGPFYLIAFLFLLQLPDIWWQFWLRLVLFMPKWCTVIIPSPFEGGFGETKVRLFFLSLWCYICLVHNCFLQTVSVEGTVFWVFTVARSFILNFQVPTFLEDLLVMGCNMGGHIWHCTVA